MSWLIVVLGYLLGSIPTAYIASRLIRSKDIRQMGDANMGAANAFRQLGAKTALPARTAHAHGFLRIGVQ